MSEIKALFQAAVNRHEQDTLFPALLGNGDGTTLYVDGLPGFVWARVTKPTGATMTQVRCRLLSPVYNAPVRVREDPIDKVLEVIREDATAAIAFFEGQSNLAGLHAGQHGYYGTDSLRLEARQYMPLLTHPDFPPSMNVVIESLVYDYNGTRQSWGGGQLDLSSLVPSGVDEQTLVIVGIDKTSNTPTYALGDTVTETNNNIQYVPFTDNQVDGVTYPADFLPSGAVRLYTDMVNIQHWDCFKDVRQWLDSGGSSGSFSFELAADSGTPETVEDGDTVTIEGGTGLSSVVSAPDTVTLNLDNTAVTPGAYTYASITVDPQGRLTAASNGAAPGTMSSFDVNGDSGSAQTISNGNTLLIAGGTGLSSVVSATDTLTLNLDNTAVTPGSYTQTNLTVDAQGRITAAANGSSTPVFSGARVYHNANQALSSGIATILAFNSERYDTNTYHDTSTNNSRLTAPSTGYYRITANVQYSAAGTAFDLRIKLNGTTDIARQYTQPGGSGVSVTKTINVTTEYYLTSGDYVQVEGFCIGGMNVLSTAQYSPEFMISLIGT